MNGASDPDGWLETIDQASKRPYYYKTSGASSWTKPDELLTPAQRATGWSQTSHTDGRPYWFSKEDRNKTSWEPPAGWNDGGRPRDPPPNVNTSLTLARDGYRDQGPRDREDHRRERPFDQGGYRGPIANNASGFENSSPAEREAAFKKLLKRVGVQQDWTWEQAIKAAVQDPAFRAIANPLERREMFDDYKADVKRQEHEREQERLVKLKNDFRAMLHRHPEVQHYSTWKHIRPIVEDETVFRSTSNEDERKAIFEEHVAELKQKYQEKRFHDHEAAIQEIGDIMKEVNIGADTRWADAQGILDGSDAFRDAKYDTLTRSEVLDSFSKHVRRLWDDINNIKQRKKQLQARQARKAREAYQELLWKLHAKDLIQSNTTWKTAYPHISADPRYDDLLQNIRTGDPRDDGSTPLDLFMEFVDELDHDLRKLAARAEDALRSSRIKLRPDLSLSDLSSAARHDKELSSLSEAKLKLVHERVMQLINSSLEDAAASERRRERRNNIDALRSRIKHLDPPITLDDTWETTRPRIERLEEYAALPDDEDRRAAFDKHLARLQDDERSRRHRRDRSRRSHTPQAEHNAYAEDRRRAIEQRERQYRHASGGLSPPPRDRRAPPRDDRRSLDDPPPPRRERGRYDAPPPRERAYVSRADPQSRGSDLLDYGDEPDTRPAKRAGSAGVDGPKKRARMEEVHSGSEEGEIEE